MTKVWRGRRRGRSKQKEPGRRGWAEQREERSPASPNKASVFERRCCVTTHNEEEKGL